MDNYQKLILHRFSFLMTDYQFNKSEFFNVAYESYIEYRKKNISILVGSEGWTLLFVGLNIYKSANDTNRLEAKRFIIKDIIM